MNTLDLTPLYRSSIGFDRLNTLLNNTLHSATQNTTTYPPYNIEITGEEQYNITLALAGFEENDIDVQVENGVLTVSGKKEQDPSAREFLHQGIANRSFERKFNLADYVEVHAADLEHGLLTISLVREVPEAMKAKTIAINSGNRYTAKVA